MRKAEADPELGGRDPLRPAAPSSPPRPGGRGGHGGRLFGLPTVLIAGLAYCTASGSMILLNKHALNPKSFGFTAPNALLAFQCGLAAALVKACEAARLVRPLQPLKRDLVAVWFPVNLLFVAMIGTSFYALQHVGVAMVTVWKNVSNFVTAVCDVTIYGKSYSSQVWATLALMLLSAVVGAYTDISFNWNGYIWQVANCGFTSAYALYLRAVMDKVAEHTTDRQKMDEFSMVYYNNLLSVPPILCLMFFFGEHRGLLAQPALANPAFLFVAALGGLIGFGISFSALWFLSQTTATIYSLVGALNKIPVAVVGILAFHEASSAQNLGSIFIGLLVRRPSSWGAGGWGRRQGGAGAWEGGGASSAQSWRPSWPACWCGPGLSGAEVPLSGAGAAARPPPRMRVTGRHPVQPLPTAHAGPAPASIPLNSARPGRRLVCLCKGKGQVNEAAPRHRCRPPLSTTAQPCTGTARLPRRWHRTDTHASPISPSPRRMALGPTSDAPCSLCPGVLAAAREALYHLAAFFRRPSHPTHTFNFHCSAGRRKGFVTYTLPFSATRSAASYSSVNGSEHPLLITRGASGQGAAAAGLTAAACYPTTNRAASPAASSVRPYAPLMPLCSAAAAASSS
jgi:GDP-mannose transporter